MSEKNLLIEYLFVGPKKLRKGHCFHEKCDWAFFGLDNNIPEKLAIHNYIKEFEKSFLENYGFKTSGNIKYTRIEIMSHSERSEYAHRYWANEPPTMGD